MRFFRYSKLFYPSNYYKISKPRIKHFFTGIWHREFLTEREDIPLYQKGQEARINTTKETGQMRQALGFGFFITFQQRLNTCMVTSCSEPCSPLHNPGRTAVEGLQKPEGCRSPERDVLDTMISWMYF